MSIADELLKLNRLHQEGMLSDEEFEKAKAAVLVAPLAHPGADHLEEIRNQNEVAQLDREWQNERERYMVVGRYGTRSIPNRATSLIGGVVIAGFGTLWTIMAASMGAPGLFPLFGVLFVLAGVGMSVYSFIKAGEYEQAYRRYQERRAALLNRRDTPNESR
jgi:hypothetical protein